MPEELLLFEDEFPVDNSPEDNTEITTTLLYYSKTELAEFKMLCKKNMQAHANVSDFVLQTLRAAYGNL